MKVTSKHPASVLNHCNSIVMRKVSLAISHHAAVFSIIMTLQSVYTAHFPSFLATSTNGFLFKTFFSELLLVLQHSSSYQLFCVAQPRIGATVVCAGICGRIMQRLWQSLRPKDQKGPWVLTNMTTVYVYSWMKKIWKMSFYSSFQE